MFATKLSIPENARIAARDEPWIDHGARVAILRLLPSPFFEGWAVVEGPASGRHRFRVRFADDPLLRDRFVHPDWQDDPERALSLLRELWRAEQTPAVSDFFPDAVT